ncbi:Galectin domain-containing protein [Meloidogyne graminicola]|uniref:Galectin domain-containing protein n=1 Tax=Meloidogyne graminicola TaxID=189291 RepID=A0A8S9ZDK2_9BILA|nr:Galectin domain-containing protein [Meloidogyne graminicola]
MKTTHHKLSYVAQDQCKLQPGQFEHNSYGLVFKRPDNLLCDELLICYPTQLSGNNTLNDKHIKEKHVQGKRIEFIRDKQLIKEYFSKINKGQYLHRYAGCGCGMEVWFKRPTTSKTIIPVIIEEKNFLGKLFKDKDCPKRHISNKKYSFGKIINNEEIFVNFTIWSGREGKSGKIQLKIGRKIIFELFANEQFIKHIFKGKIIREIKQPINMLSIGATLILTFRYSSDMWGTEFVVTNGDFIIVTPVIGQKLNYKEIINMQNIFKHKKMNKEYIINVNTIRNDNVTFRFYCNTDLINVDFTNNKLLTSSNMQQNNATIYYYSNISIIKPGKLFEINMLI